MTKRPRSILGPSKPIDRRIPGIGRIRCASGLPDGAQWRAMNDMVTELARDDEGRALLREVYEGRLQIDVLRTHHKQGTLHLVPLGTAASGLVAALETWREDTKDDVSADTYRVRKELVRAIRDMPAKMQPKSPAIVASLPDYMRVLRVHMKGARSFNLLRSYAMAFVRDTLGKQSAVYAGVQGVTPRKVRATLVKRPLTPREVRQLGDALSELRTQWSLAHPSPKATRRLPVPWEELFAMALTRMNPKEYAGKWVQRLDSVRVYGTKRAGRVREIPRVWPCKLLHALDLPRPSVSTKVFGRCFRAAADLVGIACTPYDLRRSYANWMESAGIPRARRRIYLGHGAADITDLYEQHEVDAFLLEDGQKLRAWIDAQLTAEVAGSPAKLTILRTENRAALA
jgi:integrase